MRALVSPAVTALHLVPELAQNTERNDEFCTDEFWTVWLQHQDYLYRFCLKWTNQNQAEADELLSLARDKAQAKWPTHAHKVTNAKSWLSSLTKHLYIDLYRVRERQARVQAGLQKEAVGAIATQVSPESNLLGDELKAYIHELVTELPVRLRNPFILRFLQEKSYKEIAFQLNITEPTARKRIQQARQQLRKPLRHYLAGLSKARVVSNSDALKDFTLLMNPVESIHGVTPTEHSEDITYSTHKDITNVA